MQLTIVFPLTPLCRKNVDERKRGIKIAVQIKWRFGLCKHEQQAAAQSKMPGIGGVYDIRSGLRLRFVYNFCQYKGCSFTNGRDRGCFTTGGDAGEMKLTGGDRATCYATNAVVALCGLQEMERCRRAVITESKNVPAQLAAAAVQLCSFPTRRLWTRWS